MNNSEPHLIYVTSNGVFIKFSVLNQMKATVGHEAWKTSTNKLTIN